MGTYQSPLQGEDSGGPSALQGLHPASPAAAAEGVCPAVLEVEAPAKERGVLPALPVQLLLLVLLGRDTPGLRGELGPTTPQSL